MPAKKPKWIIYRDKVSCKIYLNTYMSPATSQNYGVDPANLEEITETFTFKAVMVWDHYQVSQGTTSVYFRDVTTGQVLEMTMRCYEQMVKDATVEKGLISGTWGFAKPSSKFSLRYVSC